MRIGLYMGAFALIFAVLLNTISFQAIAQNDQSNTFTIKGSTITSCWYFAVEFNATRNEIFHIGWTTPNRVPTALDLYIASPPTIRGIWYCDYGPEGAYYDSGASNSAGWIAPTTGEYIALLVNNNRNSVSGTLSIVSSNATVAVVAIGYAAARQEPICAAECPSQRA